MLVAVACILLGVLLGGALLAVGVVAPLRMRLRRAKAANRNPAAGT